MSSVLTREEDVPSDPGRDPRFDRPSGGGSVGVAEAVRRHPLLAALPAIVLVVLALAYGFVRTPTYTAEAYQSIGRIDVNQPGSLSGFQQATETLATTYSRAVRGTEVVEAVSRETGLTVPEVRARLGSYPVPESSVFVVVGTGPSAASAMNVSNRGARALRRYVVRLNTRNPNGARLFRQFRQASYDRARARDRLEGLKAEFRRRNEGRSPSARQRQSLARARGRLDAAALRQEVARTNYAASQGSESMVSLVQNLARAESASSNRFERLQILLFIALSVGVLLGLALATLRANRGRLSLTGH